MKAKYLFSGWFLTLAGVASAGRIGCCGTVTYLSFHAPDTFMIQSSSLNAPVLSVSRGCLHPFS